MVTCEPRGRVWDLKRNGVTLMTLMRRVTKDGIEYYDWTTSKSLGDNLDQICQKLSEEMAKNERTSQAAV